MKTPRKPSSLSSNDAKGENKPETETKSKHPPLKLRAPKSESYVYENLRLKKNSLPCRESQNKRQLIPTPENLAQPGEVLRSGLVRLKSSQWTESITALKDIVQISRFHSQLLQKYLPVVYKEMTSLVQHPRTTAIRTACQAANEIFTNVPPSEGPELEDLVCVLLQKTAETNPLISEDASEALDSMLMRIPPITAIKILLNKRIMNLSESARTTATKLLVCAVHSLGIESGLTISKDLKSRLVNATVELLQDDCFEIKVLGMNLVTMFMQNEEFTNIFQTKFNSPKTRKVTRPETTVSDMKKI